MGNLEIFRVTNKVERKDWARPTPHELSLSLYTFSKQDYAHVSEACAKPSEKVVTGIRTAANVSWPAEEKKKGDIGGDFGGEENGIKIMWRNILTVSWCVWEVSLAGFWWFRQRKMAANQVQDKGSDSQP